MYIILGLPILSISSNRSLILLEAVETGIGKADVTPQE